MFSYACSQTAAQHPLASFRPPVDGPELEIVRLFRETLPARAPRNREPSLFRHFLQCLRTQARAASLGSFESTLFSYRQALDAAQAVLERLDKKSVSSKQRNILASECIDVIGAGLHVLERNHGPRLRRLWGRLS